MSGWKHTRRSTRLASIGSRESTRQVPVRRQASRDGVAPNKRRAYEFPERLPTKHWALAGEWRIGPESVALQRTGGASPTASTRETRISCCSRFARADPFRASSTARLRDGRMYQLVRQHDAVREHTLETTFLEPGAQAYAFTFG